jgi:hypothetical protein
MINITVIDKLEILDFIEKNKIWLPNSIKYKLDIIENLA